MSKLKPIGQKDIKEFIKQAEVLRKSNYLNVSTKKYVNILYDEGVKFSANLPHRDDIEVILMRIRPFIEYKERLHVGRIITFLLSHHGESEFLRTNQLLFQEMSERNYPAISVENKEYRMRELLILYMYGKYFHVDQEKQEIKENFERVFGRLTEYFALSQIDKYIGIIFSVAGYILKNKLYEESLILTNKKTASN